MNIDQLMRMLPNQRSKATIVPQYRGAYRPRRVWTEDELLTHLRAHDLRTTGAVRRHHAEHKDAPTVYDFAKVFGAWSAAAEKAFGPQMPFAITPKPSTDPQFIVKCCELYGIKSQREYLAVRRAHPDVVPSSRQVRRVWGGFKNLFWACQKQSAKRTFEAYLILERKLGRIPSALECRAAHLDLAPLRKVMGSKWDIDDLLSYRRNLARNPGGEKENIP